MADCRPITYVEDNGTIVYRASAIGICRVALIASRLGIEPSGTPDQVREAAAQGVELEDVALGRLLLDGWELEQGQRLVEREVPLSSGATALVRGHVDSIGDPRDGGGSVVVEVKSRSERDFARLVAEGLAAIPESHLWQMSAYAHTLGLKRVAYVAISRANPADLHVLLIPAPVTWTDIEARVVDVEEAVLWGELPVCHGKRDTWCPYYHLHEARPYDEAHDIAEAARDYHEAAAAERAWSERKDLLRGPLLAALGERKRVRAGDLTVEVQGGKTPRLVVRPAREEIA
jgi:hypothetical protein